MPSYLLCLKMLLHSYSNILDIINMKQKYLLFTLFILMLVGLSGCAKEEPSGVLADSQAGALPQEAAAGTPFTARKELEAAVLENVAHFEVVRRIAALEIEATGLLEAMRWQGGRLSELPVAIYDFNSKPRYYDFTAYDAAGQPVGTVRTYAKKERSTVIEGMYPGILDYHSLLAQSAGARPALFMNWAG